RPEGLRRRRWAARGRGRVLRDALLVTFEEAVGLAAELPDVLGNEHRDGLALLEAVEGRASDADGRVLERAPQHEEGLLPVRPPQITSARRRTFFAMTIASRFSTRVSTWL